MERDPHPFHASSSTAEVAARDRRGDPLENLVREKLGRCVLSFERRSSSRLR
jgi:hypothetical protein